MFLDALAFADEPPVLDLIPGINNYFIPTIRDPSKHFIAESLAGMTVYGDDYLAGVSTPLISNSGGGNFLNFTMSDRNFFGITGIMTEAIPLFRVNGQGSTDIQAISTIVTSGVKTITPPTSSGVILTSSVITTEDIRQSIYNDYSLIAEIIDTPSFRSIFNFRVTTKREFLKATRPKYSPFMDDYPGKDLIILTTRQIMVGPFSLADLDVAFSSYLPSV